MWLHLYFAQRIAHRTTLSESLEPSTAKAIRWYTIFLFSEHSIIGLSLYLFPSLRLCWKFYTSSSYFYEQPPPSLFAAHVITYTTNIRRPPPPLSKKGLLHFQSWDDIVVDFFETFRYKSGWWLWHARQSGWHRRQPFVVLINWVIPGLFFSLFSSFQHSFNPV